MVKGIGVGCSECGGGGGGCGLWWWGDGVVKVVGGVDGGW